MFALKGPDISSELAILELLHSTDLSSLPLFVHHLRAHSHTGLPFSQVAATEAATAAASAHPSKPVHVAMAPSQPSSGFVGWIIVKQTSCLFAAHPVRQTQ